MALKRIVKVGNITNLSDARYCSGMGVDMLGFRVIEGQENYLPAALYQEIKGWISGPKVVAELYGMEDASTLSKILEAYQPDLLEVSEKELALMPAELQIPILLSGDLDEKKSSFTIEYLIPASAGIETEIPILSYCDNVSALDKILVNPAIKGIVLKGSPEAKPGQQDYDHLADILEALEISD